MRCLWVCLCQGPLGQLTEPRIQDPWEALSPSCLALWLAQIHKESVDRAFFYVFAEKLSQVYDEEKRACTDGNYWPAWVETAVRKYPVKCKWAQSLWSRDPNSRRSRRHTLNSCTVKGDGSLARAGITTLEWKFQATVSGCHRPSLRGWIRLSAYRS